MKLTINKNKTIVSVCLFVLIFDALLTIASLFDLQISKILTKGSLPEGEYISTNGFALFFEAVGVTPFYIMICIAGAIAFWYGYRRDNYKAKVVYMLIGAAVIVVALFLLYTDLFKYTGEYIGARLSSDHNILIGKAADLSGSLYIKFICLILSLVGAFLLLFAWRNISKETNDSLIKWAYMIVAVVACVIIIELIKNPVGRVRFRTMNYLNDFDYYTPWYVANGKRKMYDLVGASKDNPLYNFVSDPCKSFPSGHTFSAGLCYTLLALPYVNEIFNKKGIKIALWCGTVTLTGVVAIARIVAGAHFMSDVLMGGTIAFVCSMIMREIFILKGAHFKAFSNKLQSQTEKSPECVEDENQTTDQEDNL